MSYSIYHDLVIKSDKLSVFKAISEPDHLEKWWPLKCSGIPQVGKEYNFNFTDTYDWYAKVQNCKTLEHIHYKMTKSDADWDSTSFGFDLNEVETGIQVKFWHINWRECNSNFKKSSFCWAMLLNGLKNYLELDIIIPFDNRS
ncbi:SRPBCC domain-containing protein [uncultured Winogradskyella sp.]|uniref:SRPBCC family protein n=1 Tax=uncultured Winogradskyella sp. TaxID=395353 RepID=UPI0030DB0E51|tara:strand:+ start:1878 stop:2306 length:429 start_codon:yes stop_codon:yes gene_type:complete